MKSCLKKVSSVRGSLERVKFSSVFSSQVGKLKKTLALGIYLNSIYWKIGKLKKKRILVSFSMSYYLKPTDKTILILVVVVVGAGGQGYWEARLTKICHN